MTNNTSLRQCTTFKTTEVLGEVRFYFTNELTGDCEGYIEPNDFGGELPEWATIGFKFAAKKTDRPDLLLTIKLIGRDRASGHKYFTVDGLNGVPEEGYIITASYNLHNWNVYEVYNEGSDFVGGKQMTIEIATTGDDPRVFVSEELSVIPPYFDKHYVQVRYSNSFNTNMYYDTGIINLINMPLKETSINDELNVETYKGDDTVHLVNSKLYRVDKFEFDIVTREVGRKLLQALSCDTLYINDIKYIAKDSKIENIKGTNLVAIEASLYVIGQYDRVENEWLEYDLSFNLS
jgi:hypothetical protein